MFWYQPARWEQGFRVMLLRTWGASLGVPNAITDLNGAFGGGRTPLSFESWGEACSVADSLNQRPPQ